ncbi:uncharacterized protein NP_1602A [Natronomonas pharaonis DSM 2160]|uniref:Uncharacterized protein n=1 Tax=Natronomonas pharaonis (strain ATCC 35678 / DSM 2160 / CIP 103997 / JCM 8858 / NBRC 14720 / NCIMB 2260 / Gabara) TaxID=348780 RepID=A0A1U7EV64_NATPD|nr:uncharacterized protein NP_1602A [Natronomonas pharaonis DSM 2160]
MPPHTPRHDRQTLLATVGSVAAVAAAGCLATGDESDTGGESGGSPAGELGSPAAETGRHDVTASHEDIRSFIYQPPDPDDQSPGGPSPAGPKRARTVQRTTPARSRSGTDTNARHQCHFHITGTTDEPF